eukprot:TRINITY_DN6828_c0_g1_i2.p1 TRINITY_DN6828_c0_g1~~TRINITY_DN6828_c0_g1_i2.p1  ORF type:complete len:176 (+),score=58.73 TRINITY_DN6828_c0_g1_i2:77-604(+)
MIRRPPRSTHCISSAASDVYKRQTQSTWEEQLQIQIQKDGQDKFEYTQDKVKNAFYDFQKQINYQVNKQQYQTNQEIQTNIGVFIESVLAGAIGFFVKKFFLNSAIDATLSTATMIGAGVIGWTVGGVMFGAQLIGSVFGTLNTKVEEIKYCEYEQQQNENDKNNKNHQIEKKKQ